MHRRQHLGQAGEDLATAHLRGLGYDIRARNWRASVEAARGEIDIVAVDGDVLVICEVRTRRSLAAGTPAESVGRDKRRRLRRLAVLYLQAHPHPGSVRGDVIAVLAQAGRPAAITHLKGAW